MKKLFILSILAIASSFSYAEDVVTVLPMKVQSGEGIVDDEMDYESVTTVNLCNSADYVGLQFDINVPAGMLVDFDAEGCSRAKFTKKGNKVTWCHTASVSDVKPSPYPGYERYTVGIADQVSNDVFVGESGEDVLNMYYGIPSTLADGVYPIYFTEIYFTNADNELISSNEGKVAVSYMVVGDAKDAALSLEGQIPSFVNEALATETGISTLDLTKVTASNGTFTYVDGRAVKAPADLKGKVAYKREVSGLASVCLPFAADLKAYTYSSMAGEYAIFDEVSALEANTPAIVDANIDITVEEATIGSVEAQTITKGYYLKGGKFYSVNGSAVVAPLRGYWELGAGVKGFKFNDADAIMTVDANANEDIFNLNGVKLNKAQRGVNIIGGKKVMK